MKAILVLLALVAAGCTVHSVGEPKPAAHQTDTEFADLLPPRPRELVLTGVDPCTDLLTDQQLRDLDYDLGYASPPVPGHDDIHGGRTCGFGSNGGNGGPNRNVDTLITISTTEGALAWVTDPARKPANRPDVVTVGGFPALVLPHPSLPDDCLIVVDTADGQYFDVNSGASNGKGASAEPYCQEAERVATMAIQTISASR
jgi:hypothetical protein